MIRMFRSKDRAEAIEFPDGEMSRVTEIAKFTGLRVTVEVNPDGGVVRAGLIRGATEAPLVVIPGQYVYKESSGKIGICDYEQHTKKSPKQPQGAPHRRIF